MNTGRTHMYKIFALSDDNKFTIRFLAESEIPSLLQAILLKERYDTVGIVQVEKEYYEQGGTEDKASLSLPLTQLHKVTEYIIEKDNKIDYIDQSIGHVKMPTNLSVREHIKHLRNIIADFTEYWEDI